MQRDDRLPIPVSWWRSVCLRIRLTSVPSSSHGRTNGRRALSSRQMMALDAARLYHLRGLDQAAVAQVLHVSRPQVSKLLATARELGYIRTHVVDPRESDRELVQTVTQRFRIAGLLLVSPSGPTTGELLHALGAGAAHVTSNLVLPVRKMLRSGGHRRCKPARWKWLVRRCGRGLCINVQARLRVTTFTSR